MTFVKRLAAVVLGFALAGATSAVTAQPAIWTVRSRTATVVLFGSIHLLPPGLDWLPPALDAAMSKADELWFEVPITALSEGEANAEAKSRGALPQGRHLFSLVTPDEAERLRRVAIGLHCDPGAIDQMQPWMAEFTLSVAEDASGGALVVVVGVGHMVGPDSLPAMLRARGFSVDGPGLPETPTVVTQQNQTRQ